ncbi:MAG: NAD(P)-dependent glycerol-3-phosphate dehydrogenase [Calditrichaeota bacterium]|nr:NAD(P)-dependent glycerol-3-phosphate dehydrogenase [Calditrichota bacterium]MBT7789460.1 NAD(P)-dependent glycerol-3-phosphate dehydrogenase [Calditrichota bacterium]
MMKIAVLGAGSWGTTLAILLARHADSILMWEFRPEAVKNMKRDRENLEFLAGFPFPSNLNVTDDINEAVADADFCLSVVPSHAVRSTAGLIKDSIPGDCRIVSASKGIEQESLMRISEVFADVLGDRFVLGNFTCLSGPSHAEEVSKGLPTTVVAASNKIETARKVQELFSGESFRVYSTDDLIGVELGGSLKNVIAIAAGIAAGLKFGDNTTGALLTRGLAEISRLGEVMGGRASTFAGLSGMGDLVTTCCSLHSRNRYVGEQLGKGRKLEEILDEMHMVAEGVRTTASAWALAQRMNIVMPITNQIHRILFENVDPREATVELMTRSLKIED